MKNQFKKFISSTVDYHNFKGALEIASELNCGIEISRFGRLKDIEDLFDVTKKEYKAALRDFEGEVTLHGFFSNLNVAAKDPLIREVSEKRYYQSLELACEFNAKTVVFHTCINNLLKHKEYRQLYFRSNIEFFHEFIPYFEKEGIIATIENVHEPDWELIRSIVATINSPNLKATIDIGHCNLHSDYPISEWIKNYGIMLHHMHFHNNYKDEDSHSSLLKGSLDIEPVIKTLNEMQLSPQITFEIFDKDELFESVKYFDDIADKIKQG